MNSWIAAAMLLAMASGVLRAAETADSPQDSRLNLLHDKDHPWGFAPAFADKAAWEKRAAFLRTQVLVAQGLWPMPPKTALNAVIHGKIDRDDYTVEKVFFASMPGHYVSGNLYRPKNKTGKLPAVLCPYGHWPNGRFIWKDDNGVKKDMDSGAEIDPVASRSPLQANCAMLARMGCVVFQYDMVGYCDSTKITHREGFTDAESILRLQSFMGLQTWNSIRSMDFVLSLPDVDPNRIAVAGSSSGGTQTMALDACDPRAAVAFPMVMVSMNMQGGCVCENAPLYRVQTNNVELAALFAPKPEGMAAANDWTIDFMKRGLPEMKSIWQLYGAAADVDGEHYNFPHNHNLHSRELQYNFLNQHLKLGWPTPVKEKPFVPIPPEQLSVYDADHPRPADEADAATLRKSMTKTSDEQMAKLAQNPAEYAKTIRAALAAMIVDQMPGDEEVEIVSGGPIQPGSATTWEGTIGRKNAHEAVPCKVLSPQKWNGGFVIWVHSKGVSSLDANDPSVQKLLSSGAAVLAIDPFNYGPKPATKPLRRPDANPPYAGFALCYERSVIADRVHDLLTAIAVARNASHGQPVKLIAFGDAGTAAMLAEGLAGNSVSRAAIDLNQFDFDQVHEDSDPMLLPGALKYGGVAGFASLCDSAPTLLCNLKHDPTLHSELVKVDHNPANPASMVTWLLEQK